MDFLRELMDARVDYFANNDKFIKLLDDYYKDRTRNDLLKEMYIICFQCACNKLKIRCGSYRGPQYIIDKALEVCAIVFSRIKNTTKYPEGYVIKNLPACVGYALLNVLYGSNKVIESVYEPSEKEVMEDSIDLDNVVSSLDEKTYRNWATTYFNGYSWEDAVIEKVDKEMNYEY